jgi:hypothetical protein
MKRILLMAVAAVALAGWGEAAERKVVFLPGPDSHAAGEHDHLTGCLELQASLRKVAGVTTVVCTNAWPANPDETLRAHRRLWCMRTGAVGTRF